MSNPSDWMPMMPDKVADLLRHARHFIEAGDTPAATEMLIWLERELDVDAAGFQRARLRLESPIQINH